MTEHTLVRDRYGKRRVHLTWVDRSVEPHSVRQLAIDVELEGDFAASYRSGDNTRLVATDSMKNTVYVLAREHGVGALEDFALALAEHFVAAYPQVSAAFVDAEEAPWRPIEIDGAPHPAAFTKAAGRDTARAVARRDAAAEVTSGICDLEVMKTADSGFSGFVDDRYRTLADTDDRLFATAVTATWRGSAAGDWDARRRGVRDALLAAFARHRSRSVQETLQAMAEAALDAVPGIAEISMVLPNQHHLLVDLAPFGLDNPNRVFVATREPYGCIEGTVRRSGG